jgi:N-acetylglucosaminyldiphosphoundecaprenol N-acetyl-beta-D-mannosaminyltransferase
MECEIKNTKTFKFVKILGTRVDNFSKEEILEKIEFFLREDTFHQIVTVNPEFILHAQEDEEFRTIINQSSLNIADGIGLKYAFFLHRKWLKKRIAGADLMHEILRLTNDRKLSVLLAMRKDGLSSYEELVGVLKKMYPDIIFSGIEIDLDGYASYSIGDAGDDILLCNLGAPFQEKFIFHQKSANIRLAMGVGGSFDFVTEKILRAPKPFRFIGLEWLWRLAQQPLYRHKRVFNAIFLFTFSLIKNIWKKY